MLKESIINEELYFCIENERKYLKKIVPTVEMNKVNILCAQKQVKSKWPE